MSWQATLESGLGVSIYDYGTLLIFLAFALIVGFGRDVRIGLITAFIIQGIWYLIIYQNATAWNIPYDVQMRALLAMVGYLILLTLSIFVSYKRGDSYIV